MTQEVQVLTLATSAEVAKMSPRFAAIAIGAYEQHGPHLPVTTDTWIASAIAEKLCTEHGGLLGPPLAVSCSHEHAGFPGTLWIGAATLIQVLGDLVASIKANGIGLTVLVNAHGGNYVLENFAQERNRTAPQVLLGPTKGHWVQARREARVVHLSDADMHAGEAETSIMMYLLGEKVRNEEAINHGTGSRPMLTTYGLREYTQSGVAGYPEQADAGRGEKLLAALVERMGAQVEDVLARIES